MTTTAFLSLEDISDNLPRYDESVISVDMDDVLKQAYEKLEEDTRAARKAIDDSFSRALSRCCYWLDLGNNAASGQFVLGQPLNARNRRKSDRLRTASELFPEIIDAEAGEDPLPSCSAVEALDRQEPFINQTLAASALAMLAQLLRYGELTYHGAFFNAKSGKMSALPVDPDLWPGNVRELQNVIERALIVCDGEIFQVDASWLKPTAPDARASVAFAADVAEREKAMIENALRDSKGLISGSAGAAAKLGLPRQTLESKIRKLGINPYRYKTL